MSTEELTVHAEDDGSLLPGVGSTNSSASPTGGEGEDEGKTPASPSQKRSYELFSLTSARQKENEWSLHETLADYVEESCMKFIPSENLEDMIMEHNPVPKNLLKVPVLDEYMKEVMKATGKEGRATIDRDKEIAKIQEAIRMTFGPLGRLLETVEDWKPWPRKTMVKCPATQCSTCLT